MEESELKTYSPLTLAFLGDALYSLYMRERVVRRANMPSHKLHAETVRYVSAPAQARAAEALQAVLTEEEQDVYRRGKNAKTGSGAKNASSEEYHKATGLECLVGWLYLKGESERLRELLSMCAEDSGRKV